MFKNIFRPSQFVKVSLVFGVICLTLSIQGLAISAHSEIIFRSQWPQYENGTYVSTLPQVARILELFEENSAVSVEISHPGGEEGAKWGDALHNWLVSFGIPSAYIELFPGSGGASQLLVLLVDRR